MISFIVIGRNIQNTVAVCLRSIVKFTKTNGIQKFELIYVDSDSTDNSIELARKFPVRIFQLKGEVNAAVGRNVGANNANGDILFFIDGDMELVDGFYEKIFDRKGSIIYPFITGFWNDRFYNEDFTYVKTTEAKLPEHPETLSVTGGLMLMETEKWKAVGGMDERLKRSQDHDLGIRMKEFGIPVIKYPYLFAIHHTVSYFDRSRISQFFRSTAILSQGLLMRKHLFNLSYIKRYQHKLIYTLLLLMAFVLLPFSLLASGWIISLYFAIQMLRSLKDKESVKQSFVYHVLFNFYVLIGLLFYFPSKPVYVSNEIT